MIAKSDKKNFISTINSNCIFLLFFYDVIIKETFINNLLNIYLDEGMTKEPNDVYLFYFYVRKVRALMVKCINSIVINLQKDYFEVSQQFFIKL